MVSRSDRTLSLREVASLLFSTKKPQQQELRWVESQFIAGRLRGKRSGDIQKKTWTTTQQQLAAFMASESYSRQLEMRGGLDAAATDCLSTSYRSVLTDYFQAVILRRGDRLRDKRFRRCVVLGQIAIVGLVMLAAIHSARHLIPVSKSADQQAIEAWIEERHDEFRLQNCEKLAAADPPATTVYRVRYRYFRSGNRAINTDRLFEMRDHRVVSVESN